MLWGHGEGFDAPTITDKEIREELGPSARRASRQGGMAFDFTSKSHMTIVEAIPEIRSVLRNRRKAVAFDIAGSDSCLNQQVEFGWEWNGIARYLFGSSTIVQKKGFNYRTLLKAIVDKPLQSTKDLAKSIPQIYGGSVGNGSNRRYSSYYDPFATLGVWDVPMIETLKVAMEDLASALMAWVNLGGNRVERTDRIRSLQKIIESTIRFGGISNDLLNFLQRLEEFFQGSPPLLREVNATRRTLVNAAIAKYIGRRYVSGLVQTSEAVSVWLPVSQTEFQEMFPKFQKSQFYKDRAQPRRLSRWARFIEMLYQ